MTIKLLLFMILAHIVDDFYLQGNLAKMKQKVWWEKLFEYKSLYKHDYKMALLIHSMSWSIMILIPSMILLPTVSSYLLLGAFIINTIIHYWIDNEKCNKLHINLMTDQTIHLLQVIVTWVLLCQMW
jgi:hypothetical protein